MVDAPEVGGARTHAELFRISETACDECLTGAILGKLPDLLAVGCTHITGICSIPNACINRISGYFQRTPPVSAAIWEVLDYRDVFIGDAIVVRVACLVYFAGLGVPQPSAFECHPMDGRLPGDECRGCLVETILVFVDKRTDFAWIWAANEKRSLVIKLEEAGSGLLGGDSYLVAWADPEVRDIILSWLDG